jgi:hypothetical protein
VLLAASDEVLVYDPGFRRLRSFRNPYLKHCHEICVGDGRLFLASTGFDSVLEYDLAAKAFVRGYCLRAGPAARLLRRLGWPYRLRLRGFDPNAPGGPRRRDTHHLNSVSWHEDALHVSGTMIPYLVRIQAGRASVFARVPLGSHNARPFRDGVLMNHTQSESIGLLDRRGAVLRALPVPRYEPSRLLHADLPRDHARQAFARGLAVHGERVIGGSSPATVTAYDLRDGRVVRSVNLTLDVRNAVHGLEVWPY